MATVEELRLFIQERLRAYDSKIRLEAGSPASVQVVEPVVRRFQPDPLETDLELFIKTRLSQEYPTLHTGEGSAIEDVLVKPLTILLEPVLREIRAIKRNQSMMDPMVLNKDEADALVSNVFVRRNLGNYAKVRVRIYFENPVSANIGGTNIAFTASGKRFLPIASQSITSEAMLFNQDGELYYFDVDYVAEGQGTSYNIGTLEIIGVTSLPAATRAANLRKAEGGLDEQTTVEMVSQAEQSIGERSLAAIPGIVAKLFDDFTELRILQVIGFNDAEMQRDVICGGSLGSVVVARTDGVTVDDGDGDGYTPYFDSAGTSFTTLLGPVGTDISSYVLTLWFPDSGFVTPHDFNLGTVIGATRIEINSEYEGVDRLPDNLAVAYWSVRKRMITLSQIPGGILFPDIGGTTVDVPADTVHVGGCTDFYVTGSETEDKTLPLSLFGTHAPDFRGKTAQTFGSNAVWLVNFTAVDEALIEVGRSTLRLLSGADVGTYRIVASSYHAPTSTIRLEISSTLTASASNILFDVCHGIDIELTNPQEVIYEGTDLRTYAGSDMADTVAATIWADWGVGSSDYLEILNGDDEGVYDIASVSGAAIYLTTTLRQTDSPLQYRILRRQTESLELPVLRVTAVEMLDSSLAPTGDVIPYRNHIDARSRSFQNPGRGPKAGSATVTTDDTISVDTVVNAKRLLSSNTTVDFYGLGVRPGDIVNVLTGDNTGYYTVAEGGVGGSPGAIAGLLDYELQVTEDLAWTDSAMSYAVGDPSYGSFRMYFLDPVGVSVDADTTWFDVTLTDGTSRRFRPDPQMQDAYLPTEVTVPTLAATVGDDTITLYPPGGGTAIYTAPHDVQVGDRCEITFAPIVGQKSLTAASYPTNGKTLLLDLGRGAEKIQFVGDLAIDAIISQINDQASRSIATKWESGINKYLTIRSDEEVTILDNSADGNDGTAEVFGTTPSTNNPWLTQPAFAGNTISNDSSYKGYWYVSALAATTIDLINAAGTAFTPTWSVNSQLGHYFVLSRSGQQSITATQMGQQRDDLGLYYFDVECISEGHGDSWNISADVLTEVTGYSSEGWSIDVEDGNLSFSMAEVPWLRISPRVLFEGSEKDPSNYTELVGSSFQVSYERVPIVEEIHSYVRSQQNRDVCESVLARALTPIFIRTTIQYRSGDSESAVRTSLVDTIESVVPEQYLEISDLVEVVIRSGAEYVQLPITVIGIHHNTDRSIDVERSENVISTERLSCLIPDDDGSTTEGASWIQLSRS
jgi:hypothetical protein